MNLRDLRNRLRYSRRPVLTSDTAALAAAVLDHPLEDTPWLMFSDYLQERHPDDPATPAFVDWVNSGKDYRATDLFKILRDSPWRAVANPTDGTPYLEVRAQSSPMQRHAELSPEEMGSPVFRREYGNPLWERRRYRRDIRNGEYHRISVNSTTHVRQKGATSPEVAQTVLDHGGLSSLLHVLIANRHFHPRETGQRGGTGPVKFRREGEEVVEVSSTDRLRYSRHRIEPHPIVAGHRIEFALQKLADAPSSSRAVRGLATNILANGELSNLYDLNDLLFAERHPLAGRYNWANAARKLELDRDLDALAHAHAARVVEGRRDLLDDGEIDSYLLHPELAYGNFRDYLRSGRPDLHHLHPESKADLADLAENYSHLFNDEAGVRAGLLESLNRLQRRHADRIRREDGTRLFPEMEIERDATDPDFDESLYPPYRAEELRATRFRRGSGGDEGSVINGEFAKLATRLGAPDADRFQSENPYGYLVKVAGGDRDLAHDMATHLLYGHEGESPLAKNYDPSRGLFDRFTGHAQMLPKAFALKARGTRSNRFAGNFTDLGFNPSEDRVGAQFTERNRAVNANVDPKERRRVLDRLRKVVSRAKASPEAKVAEKQRSQSRRDLGRQLPPEAVFERLQKHLTDEGLSLTQLIRKTQLPATKLRSVIAKAEEGGLLRTEVQKKSPSATGPGRLVVYPQKYSRQLQSDFLDALRRVRSRQQESLRQIATLAHQALGLTPASVRDAIADAGHSAINGVATASFHDADPATIEYLAANVGSLSQSPGMVAFHVHDDGPDSVYKVKLRGTGDGIRGDLDRFGIRNRILLPTDDGFDVIVVDSGGRMRQSVDALASARGVPAFESKGTAVVLGDGLGPKADAGTRKDYRTVISQYEAASNGNLQPATTDGQRPSPGANANAPAG